MKCLSIILLFVFLLGCKVDVDVEKENPLEGTTWEQVSSKYTRGDGKIVTSPKSKYDRAIMVFGKTHFAYVGQDTSRKRSDGFAGTYIIKGDSMTSTFIMYRHYEDIGRSFTSKFQIEGDQMVYGGEDLHFGGRDWKAFREEWKRID